MNGYMGNDGHVARPDQPTMPGYLLKVSPVLEAIIVRSLEAGRQQRSKSVIILCVDLFVSQILDCGRMVLSHTDKSQLAVGP